MYSEDNRANILGTVGVGANNVLAYNPGTDGRPLIRPVACIVELEWQADAWR